MRLQQLPKNGEIRNGRVLALKEGYNPNSSSLGSVVFSFPEAWLAAPAIAGVVTAAVASWTMKKAKSKEENESEDK